MSVRGSELGRSPEPPFLQLGRTFGRADYYRCVFQPPWTAARHVANMYWNSRCEPSSRARDMSWTRDLELLRGRTPACSSDCKRDFRGEHDNVGNIQDVLSRSRTIKWSHLSFRALNS